MRYIFVSDIHGQYDKMIEALDLVGFDKSRDTLVSVGDPFDRGKKSLEVLQFFMSCPNRILIWGNHDARLYRVKDCGEPISQYDYMNGMHETLVSFYGLEESSASIDTLLTALPTNRPEVNKLLEQYFNECVFAIEFSSIIATHGWLPFGKNATYDKWGQPLHVDYSLNPDWRELTGRHNKDWYDAMWAHTQIMSNTPEAYPEKTLVLGHWHAWRLAEAYGHKRQHKRHGYNYIDCSTYIHTDKNDHIKFIAIDGCTNYVDGGRVNVFEYSTIEIPKSYR